MTSRSKFKKNAWELSALALALSLVPGARAADTDIYRSTAAATVPNVMFLLDNTSNWSSKNQDWNAGSSWTRCNTSQPALTNMALNECKVLIEKVYYPIRVTGDKLPWETGYAANNNNVELTQGQVQLRALKLVLNELVCNGTSTALPVNVGLTMLGDSGTVRNNGDSSGFVPFAAKRLTGTSSSGTCQSLIALLNTMDSKINSPTYKAPANANYGAAMFEIFKYFGGHSNPIRASQSEPNGASPESSSQYGPRRFSKPNTLDDTAALTADKLSYISPITNSTNCGNNYMVLIGNGYPNAEPAGPASLEGLGYTPPSLSSVTSDTTRKADEWSYFLANTDVSPAPGIQNVKTFAINTYNTKPDANQAKLLKSMAIQGGVGAAGYIEVGGDLTALIDALRNTFINIAAINSVFTATTLPVSTTTQGTYLNQIFVGMFRPDSTGSPRWLGNLKQYKLGFVNDTLDLVDARGQSAISPDGGFFSATAESFWSSSSVFFDQSPSGTPASASDLPDGAVVEKGGAAQKLRTANLTSTSGKNVRKVYTLPLSPTANASLSATPFEFATGTPVSAAFNEAEVNWLRGVDNNPVGDGAESFTGSQTVSGATAILTNGARHSMHGDVLHSRPVAVNYGGASVVVYYGSNDGHFHAVDGQTVSTTAGQELWSFLPPELYVSSAANLKRLRNGEPKLHIPENDSSGALTTPQSDFQKKTYGMDGPIGTYANYSSSGILTEGIIYPTMRRGGSTVYALDVTNKDNPKFKWKITGGTGDYVRLAQTWSIPKPIFLPSTSAANSSTPPILLVMGGGYDQAEDALIGVSTSIASADRKGNAIYIINGRTGALIKALPTDYSVPSDVSLIDMDNNGVPDRGYVADVRGNLYRFDFPTGDLTDAARWASVSPVKLAELNGKVFFPPDLIRTKEFVTVLVGTGDREKPLQSTTADNFYLIKDRPSTTSTLPLQKSALALVAKIDNATMRLTVSAPVTTSDFNGCYVELATNGEKVVNAPLSVAGATYFGTNRPKPTSSNQCNADLGEAYAYKFPLFCKTPLAPTSIVGGGMVPNPVSGVVAITNARGQEQLVPFLIGGGKGGSNFRPEKPEPVVAPVRKRLYWRIDNSNR